MKKQTSKVLLGAATVAALASAASDAKAAKTAALSISALIIAPIAVSAQNNLDFGTFTHTAADTITVPPDGTGAGTGGGGVSLIGGDAVGTFKVKGANTYKAVFTLSNTGVATLTHTTAATTMTVDTFKFGASSKTSGSYFVTLGTTWVSNLPYGATLNVAGTEAAGLYQGTITLTAAYQ